MYTSHSLPYLGLLILAVAANKMLDECLESKREYTLNVVLLEDNSYQWSLPGVIEVVKRAIEEDWQENIKHGMD